MKLKYLAILAFSLHQSVMAAQQFASPEAAGEALLQAAEHKDSKALQQLFGKNSLDLIRSGDPVADANSYSAFANQYREAHQWTAVSEQRKILEIGSEQNPFAIPLVRKNKQWEFDLQAGRAELLTRRIGLNELSTIEAIKSYAAAQREYYLMQPEGNALLHYADRFASSPDRRDGLYWPANSGKESPLGPFFASAAKEGYAKANSPYHGYHFKILKQQGPAAAGGAYQYVENGKMFGGFAIVAWPANYGNSGVMSFISNQDGTIYQRNLGKDSAKMAQKMTSFNPDKSWKIID
ncbi:DUF2950 domain-containing protein [Deefgea rivuli]|uniref:DUF2950 domain-containing protein n=1 Tax=Deefgea rivuli TaxID=400948 RepID=UPI0006868A1E|nr:DUF2950 domain-containing protein [Deefgea rivuli]